MTSISARPQPVTSHERQRVAEAIYGLGAAVVRRVPREVSLTAISTMATIDRTGPRRITDLAAAQGVSQPSMTALVTGLERDGYVERHGDPGDRRVALVSLTSAGVDALRARRQAATASVADLLDGLTEAEVGTLVAATEALDRLRTIDERRRETTGALG